MDMHALVLFIHILSFVFWLGTDLGVFVLGKFAQNSDHTVSERLLLLKVAMILDIFPRVFMVITIPTGYQLALNLGLFEPISNLTAMVWVFAAIWLVAVLTGIFKQKTPPGEKAKYVEKACLYILLIFLGWAGLSSLFFGAPVAEAWLAGKIVLYALIIVFMFPLEAAFAAVVDGFTRLAMEGSSPDLENQIRGGMDKTYIWVLGIYGAVFFSALFGVWKLV